MPCIAERPMAPRDRVQMVKGWRDHEGILHEKVFDIAWSDNRKPDSKTGKLPPVGNTVNVSEATWPI